MAFACRDNISDMAGMRLRYAKDSFALSLLEGEAPRTGDSDRALELPAQILLARASSAGRSQVTFLNSPPPPMFRATAAAFCE